ncbi:hypothetical protein L596_016726 [Steinernema carpocapsae]|uniref:Uncharacterized protein n=1 Tax=Steinernema carpocapsae TaxID=34508 RepID=A0A4U5NJQ6_STECR|nr:hypothetical protein L596_016726 [Steinernema carpocapsae]
MSYLCQDHPKTHGFSMFETRENLIEAVVQHFGHGILRSHIQVHKIHRSTLDGYAELANEDDFAFKGWFESYSALRVFELDQEECFRTVIVEHVFVVYDAWIPEDFDSIMMERLFNPSSFH